MTLVDPKKAQVGAKNREVMLVDPREAGFVVRKLEVAFVMSEEAQIVLYQEGIFIKVFDPGLFSDKIMLPRKFYL